MSQFIARRVLESFGPCRILEAGTESINILSQLLLSGGDAWAWAEQGAEKPLPRHARMLATLDGAGDYDVVILHPARLSAHAIEKFVTLHPPKKGLALCAQGSDRQRWDNLLLGRNWRRHPTGIRPFEYDSLDPLRMPELFLYEPVAGPANPAMPDGSAAAGDILRIGGVRGDFLISLYALASAYVRNGDSVLDCGCGAGAGLAVVAALTYGGSYLGIGASDLDIEYAQRHYSRDALAFRSGNPAELGEVAAGSIDCLIALELPEEKAALDRLLENFLRVLSPDGRVILGMRSRQEQTLAYFREKVAALFIPEGGNLLKERTAQGECRHIVVASRDPTRDVPYKIPYRHPDFISLLDASRGGVLLDFGAGYDNPWIYRALVQIGERLNNNESLIWLARRVLSGAGQDSADRAAALTVIGYQTLENYSMEGARVILAALEEFQAASAESRNPHVLRWRISTAFLSGRLAEMLGDREAALSWFLAASQMDWEIFSPILATKTVAAAFHAGILLLVNRRDKEARASFRRGLDESLRAAAGKRADIIGNPDLPIPFGMPELAEVIDMGGQCALALRHFDLWKSQPGLFWRKIDVKRFGLLSFNRDLTRENAMLRAEIELLRRKSPT